jgi:hypothetical protein
MICAQYQRSPIPESGGMIQREASASAISGRALKVAWSALLSLRYEPKYERPDRSDRRACQNVGRPVDAEIDAAQPNKKGDQNPGE